jgi:hypothetical protein
LPGCFAIDEKKGIAIDEIAIAKGIAIAIDKKKGKKVD